MYRMFAIALSVSLFPWIPGQAFGQVVVPEGLPLRPAKQQKEQIEQLQRQLDMIRQAALQRKAGAAFPGNGAFLWGGLRLNSVDAALKEELGLAENEGLVVAQVEPNSVADNAGLKPNDVLVKINNKIVPADLDRFSKLVKDQKSDEPIELVVVREGKEQTLKAARMPAVVQGGFDAGKGRRPGGFGLGGVNRIQIVQRNANGGNIVRRQTDSDFFGEYSRDDLKITVVGRIDDGAVKTTAITVQDGKETKNYASLKETPERYRPMLELILPAAAFRGNDR